MNGLAYLVALAILMINDHVLKALAPGVVTGKLSDFAGLFAFAVFLRAFLPRRIALVIAGAFFVYWKSPWSQPLIDALPWDAARVVDWTDLAALLVLPFAARVRIERPRTAIAALSLVAFAATSVPHQSIHVTPDTMPRIETKMSLAEVERHFKRCGFHPYVLAEGPKQVAISYRSALPGRHDVTAYVLIQNEEDVVLEIAWINVFTGKPVGDERAYLDELVARIEKCR